jgi:translation elongation factor EF-G
MLTSPRVTATIIHHGLTPHTQGPATGFVDVIRDYCPTPLEAAKKKVEHLYTGPLDSRLAKNMIACDPEGILMVHVTKLYPSNDASSFTALGRVFSGTLTKGMTVAVLGELHSKTISSMNEFHLKITMLSLSSPSVIPLLLTR